MQAVDFFSYVCSMHVRWISSVRVCHRYQPDPDADIPAKTSDDDFIEKKEMLSSDVESRESLSVSLLFRPASSLPTAASSTIVNWSLALSG